MKQKISDITINGSHYNSADLLNKSNNKIQSKTTHAWEIALYRFIRDWISDSSTIEVKTSGSTGEPKIILLEKEKMIQSAFLTGDFFQLEKSNKALLCLPVDFIAGKMMVVRAFVLGLNLITVEPKGNPIENIDEEFYFAAMTPMQVSNILKNKEGINKVNQIQNLIIGGGEINKELAHNISKLKNNSWHTYGMTETITHVALKKLNEPNPTNYFEALSGINFEKDKNDCLVIKASYLSNTPIITNDIVNLLSETKFEFTGRIDNVINSAGIKLFPENIEQKLQPWIKQSFVVLGIPDRQLGEKAVLVIEGKGEKEYTPDYLKAGLSKYEIPKKIFFISEFPKTENGKIIRSEVLKLIK